MLVLSDTASMAIRSLVDDPDQADVSGLRIAVTPDGTGRIGVSAAGMPEEGDEVVEDRGARVFLERAVVPVLDDKVLDASIDDQGRLGFNLSSQ
jgi:iron-sulfur cluster assembly protein